MPRILLLHATVGLGHQRAAVALARAFEEAPGTTAIVEDTLDHTTNIFRLGYAGLYHTIANSVPALWSMFYSYSDRPRTPNALIDGARLLSSSASISGLRKLIRRVRPDAIICTHFYPLETLEPLRRRGLPPVYLVLTDYHAHSFWTGVDADGYFVPSHQTRREMIAAGISPWRVHTTGIPIDPALCRPIDRAATRRALNLPTDRQVVTLIGSGLTSERVRSIVEALLDHYVPATLVVAAGRNHTLCERLTKLATSAGDQLRVIGFQPSLDPLIAASDLVISKAGGLTTSEILARGVPLVIPAPLPGQEQWNARYVVEAGAGLYPQPTEALPRAVVELMHDPERRYAMSEAARSLARPDAAYAIVRHVFLDLDRARAQIRPQPLVPALPAMHGR